MVDNQEQHQKDKPEQESNNSIKYDEKAELDENRPNFTIGYKKGSKESIIVKSNSGAIEQTEVAIMLTHAQAVNTLSYFNMVRAQENAFREAVLKNKLKNKQDERGPKTNKVKSKEQTKN